MNNTQLKHKLKMMGLGFLIVTAIVYAFKLVAIFPILLVILPALYFGRKFILTIINKAKAWYDSEIADSPELRSRKYLEQAKRDNANRF